MCGFEILHASHYDCAAIVSTSLTSEQQQPLCCFDGHRAAELTRLTATSGDAQHAEARERVDLVATRAVVEARS